MTMFNAARWGLNVLRSAVRGCLVMGLASCGPSVPRHPGAEVPESQEALQQSRDQVSYEDLRMSLQRQASPAAVDGNATYLSSSDHAVYWLLFATYTPTLYRLAPGASEAVAYGFSVGSDEDYNYRASDSLVVSAASGTSEYTAYQADQAHDVVGRWQPPPPRSGQKWWSYAVYGNVAYALIEDGDETQIWRWQPPQAATPLLTIAARDAGLGEITDIGVDESQLIILARTGLWVLDLETQALRRAHVPKELGRHVSMSEGAIVFETNTPASVDVHSLDRGSLDPTDLSAMQRASSYRLFETYPTSHYIDEHGFTRWRDWVIYSAFSGIFALNLETGATQPLLLETLQGSVDGCDALTDPVSTRRGALFVRCLSATDQKSSFLTLDLNSHVPP